MDKKNLEPVFYTRNKKPVFDAQWHKSYDDFSIEDHEDASSYHFNQWETLYEELIDKTNSTYHDNNKRLIKHERNWELHEKFKTKFKLELKLAERKRKREEKAAIPLTKYEQEAKEEKARLAKEFREKKKNLSEEDKLLVVGLQRKLLRLSHHHPHDSLNFGVSVSEERQEARAKIKSIINNSK